MDDSKKNQKGVALIMIFLIMAVVIAIVLSVSVILFNEINTVGNTDRAVKASHLADSGIEEVQTFDSKQIPIGAGRGFCSICANGGSKLQNCTYTPLAFDGCDVSLCNNCQVDYDSVSPDVPNGLYVVRAQVIPDTGSAQSNPLTSVTFGNNLFVGVSNAGTGTLVEISLDGKSWSTRVAANNNQWQAVTYGDGLYVAVAGSGFGNRVMTSPDGTVWTARTSAGDYEWDSITYGNGLFVAASFDGYVMSSPDGITWTLQKGAPRSGFHSVAYGNGIYVITGGYNPNFNTGGIALITSPDAVTWTERDPSYSADEAYITYGNGLFVAGSYDYNTSDGIITSPDGITWTRTTLPGGVWRAGAYGNGMFVLMGFSGSLYCSSSCTNTASWSQGNIPYLDYQGSGYYGSLAYDPNNGVWAAVEDSSYAQNTYSIWSGDGINWNATSTIGSALLISTLGYDAGVTRPAYYSSDPLLPFISPGPLPSPLPTLTPSPTPSSSPASTPTSQ